MKESKNSLTIPTWIIAIVAVLSLFIGVVGKGWIDNKKFDEYEQTIEYLKIPGENPRIMNNFEFKLLDLSFIERSVKIEVLVTSQETTKKLSVKKASRLIDNFGNVYKPVELKLGSDIDRYSVSETLPADVGIMAQFSFKNLSSKATGIKLFEINTNMGVVAFTNDDFIKLENSWLPNVE